MNTTERSAEIGRTLTKFRSDPRRPAPTTASGLSVIGTDAGIHIRLSDRYGEHTVELTALALEEMGWVRRQ